MKVALCINFPSRLNPDNLTNAGDIHVYTSGLKTHLSSAKNCKQINFDPSQSLRISVTLQINSSRLKSVQQRNRSLFDLISDNSPKGKCKKCILGKLCVTGDCSEKRPFTNILIPDSSSGPDSLWIDINISLTLVTSYSSCESFPTRTADLISPLSPGRSPGIAPLERAHETSRSDTEPARVAHVDVTQTSARSLCRACSVN